MDRDAESERHPDEDDENLVALGEADDFRAADHGVGDDESAGEPDGEIQIPPEQCRKNNRRRVNRDPAGDAALDKKQEPAEEPGFFIEALSEIFVGGENFQPLINRDEDGANHDEREWLSEIILNEPDPAFVGLTRHREKRDRAGLGDRKS